MFAVVDLMHGLEPQTIESINILRMRKTPFVVALNKIDRCFKWKPNPNSPFQATLEKQDIDPKNEFERRTKEVIVQFAEQSEPLLPCCLAAWISLLPVPGLCDSNVCSPHRPQLCAVL